MCLTLRYIFYAQCRTEVQTHCRQSTKASVVLWHEDRTSYPLLKRNISKSDLAKNDIQVPWPKLDYILLPGQKIFRFIYLLVILRSKTERSTKENNLTVSYLYWIRKGWGIYKGIYCLPHAGKKKKEKAQTIFQVKEVGSIGKNYLLFRFVLPVDALQQDWMKVDI